MPVRTLLPIAVLLAVVSIRCAGSPSEPAGTVNVTVTTTTTTTTTIPAVSAGAISASPTGLGVAAATVFNFSFTTQPSGGVGPYTVAWNFGDGQEGTGTAPAHVYNVTGNFTVTATVTDSRGTSARTTTSVSVRNVTGQWTAIFGRGNPPLKIDLIQNGAAVTATSNDALLGFGSGSGNVSNPRSLSLALTYGAGTPTVFAATFVGTLEPTLLVWNGTVSGFTGCPCAFTATRPSIVGDVLTRQQ